MLRGFATINYWTDDLEAAKQWYAELLGVEPYLGAREYQPITPRGDKGFVTAAVVDRSGTSWG